MSGRSSRSTLILTNSSFMTSAVAESSKLSCAMTWHQWQAAYPTESRMGLLARFASASASGPQGHQSTGLCLCCSRYGLVSRASRFSWAGSDDDDMVLGALRFRLIYRAATAEPPETDDRISARDGVAVTRRS